jgi:hypothetical protein
MQVETTKLFQELSTTQKLQSNENIHAYPQNQPCHHTLSEVLDDRP